MNIKEAQDAITAILDDIPDSELPEFDKIELDGPRIIAWWGSTGHHLGSAKSEGERDPLVLRRRGVWGAIEYEMTYRADRRLLDNGDDPAGVRLGKKKVRR